VKGQNRPEKLKPNDGFKEEGLEMFKKKVLGLMAGLATVAVLGVACTTTPASQAPAPTTAPSQQPAAAAPVAPSQPSTIPVSSSAVAPREGTNSSVASYAPSAYYQVGGSQTGIWVNGQSSISVSPDMVILNVGVQTTAKTVAEANRDAAEAMDAIIAALKARGLTDKDIQTTSYNVWPQYDYQDVVENGIRTGRQILTGYQVSNNATIKVRDLDNVGAIIDEVSVAGGDATRINGISFTVEDPKPLMNDLREAAVKDAMAKAQQFADLTGVGLGRLVFITELGGSSPVVIQSDAGYRMEAAMAAPMPSTPVSGGEMDFNMTIQAVFEIL
jgi:hypothetical protein